MENGTLYVVATPIGNLDDITFRAVKVLKSVDLIAAEDTRHTLKLLNHLEISKPLVSYYRHNEDVKSNVLIEKLENGQNIALVSDAGTPGICDPGEEVIKKCIELGINVVPIPGACALINSLICSGIDTSKFTFLGFLSINKKIRKQELHEIEVSTKTIVFYEAPHRIEKTLNDLKEILTDDRKVTLAREMTKIHEEFIRGNIDEVIGKSSNLKGEIVIIVEGMKLKEEDNKYTTFTIEQQYDIYKNLGMEKKEIIKKIAKNMNTNKNEIYQKFIDKK